MDTGMGIMKVKLVCAGLSVVFMLIHVMMFVLFSCYGVIPMARFNIFSIVFYIITLFFVKAGYLWIYSVSVYLEVVAHMTLSVFFTGADGGFHITLIGMTALAFCAEYMSVKLKKRRISGIALSCFGMIAYLACYLYSQYYPAAYSLPHKTCILLQLTWGVVVFTANIFFLKIFVMATLNSERKYLLASKAKSEFLANMSHEIRTPINAIQGMNEMILREEQDSRILGYAFNIRSATKTLLSLVNAILDFSKIEEGKIEIIPANYSTASMVNNVVNSILERTKSKGLAFVVDVDENLPCTLLGDDVRISQVIMNLLTNAVKYTEKGTVTFSIREMGREGDQIDLLVSVKDTGIGIRQEDMGKLFEPFDRIEEKRNRNIEGTGLGMAIVNRLLPMMGGELHVESVYGEGSEFFFTLRQGIVDSRPVGNYVERLRESEVQSVNGPSLYVTGARVLVVDDNETNLKVAENLLGLDGIIPDLAQSGTDAIALIRESCYDIIFLDHMMPEMDGIETLQELRNRNLLGKETVVIALTANAIVGAKETYLAAGFDDYLSKPIEFSKLEEQLLLYLPKERCRIVYGSNGDGARLPHTGSGGNRKKDDAQDEPAGTDEILASLAKHGIHTDAGLKYSAGNTDIYLETLRNFAVEAQDKAAGIRNDFDNGDLHDYRIRVHALKTVAKTVGADDLSSIALAQENAAGAGDAALVDEGIEELLMAYLQTAGIIKDILAVEDPAELKEGSAVSELTEIDPEEFRQKLSEAAARLDSFEAAEAEAILKSLLSFSYRGKPMKTVLSDILSALDDFDTFTATAKITSLLNETV